jgi:hypothetical protein
VIDESVDELVDEELPDLEPVPGPSSSGDRIRGKHPPPRYGDWPIYIISRTSPPQAELIEKTYFPR